MAKRKNQQIGTVMRKTHDNGRQSTFITLGNTRAKDPKWNYTVEFVVKDGNGNVIAKQTNGFVNVVDPRTQPQELLEAGLISEDVAQQMMERAEKIPEAIVKQLFINLT